MQLSTWVGRYRLLDATYVYSSNVTQHLTFTMYAQNVTLWRTEGNDTYAKMERNASARRVGEESTATVCLLVTLCRAVT